METEKRSGKSLENLTCDLETWRPIEGYEGVYEVSDRGNVRKNGELRSVTPWNLYCVVKLNRGGSYKTVYVHRLVAKAFIPNPHGKQFVNHKDGNKLNNHADNLEWCTRQENEIHAWKNGMKEKIRMTSKANAAIARSYADSRIPVTQLSKSGMVVREWASIADAMRETGIDGSSISKCCRGKLKQTGGYKWQYTA